MKKLSIALVTLCLLACGGPADPVDASPTAGAQTPAGTPAANSAPPTAETEVNNAPAPPKRDAGIDPAQFKTVHRYTKMFYDGQIDLLYAQFSDGMAESFPLEQLSKLYEQVGELYGKEVSVLGEETQSNEEYRAFARWARFDKTDEIIEVQWILNPQDEIAGFFVRPAQREMQTRVEPVETP